MINSELLKEAIADAKAVRATALANAKAALDEAFAPRFEAMFAEKLKEESEEEQEESVNEVEAPNNVDASGGEANAGKTKAVSSGQPKKKNDSATQFKPVKAGKGPSDVQNPTKKVNENEAAPVAPAVSEAAEEEEEGKMEETAVPTNEDLEAIIKELEAECAGEEEGMPHAEPHAEEPAGDIPPAQPAEAPAVDINVDAQPEAGAPEGLPAAEIPAPVGGEEPAAEQPPVAPQAPKGDEDEDINLDELLAALNEESKEPADHKEEEDEKTMDESKDNGVPKNVDGQDAKWKTTSNKDIEANKNPNHNIKGKGNIGGGEVGGKPKMEESNVQLKVALNESYKTIEYLRGQINEVNLLNAKLLYTNKLFKEFAGVLDDPYRMKIVEAFDLTKSVREVKLAYALLAESLNFGTKVSSKPAPKPAQKGTVKQITEGLASKPVASTKPAAGIISEGVVTEMAARFKKLAGIKTAPTKK